MVRTAIQDWDLADLSFLFVKNFGNPVCPGDDDLGRNPRIMLIPTTEGEEKPLTYPTLISTCDGVVINEATMTVDGRATEELRNKMQSDH